jgi:hypothetical protein
MKTKKFLMALAIAVLLIYPLTSKADIMIPDRDPDWWGIFTSDHITGSPTQGTNNGHFGEVDLWDVGTDVVIKVHLYDTNGFVATGAGDNQDFKFNGTGVALGDITVQQNAIYPLFATTGAYNGDGTGLFAFGITGYTGAHPPGTSQPTGGAGAFYTDIIFQVAGADIADLTATNNLGNIFVADIIVGGAGGLTGPVDVNTQKIPEPGILILLGIAMTAVGVGSRFVRKI